MRLTALLCTTALLASPAHAQFVTGSQSISFTAASSVCPNDPAGFPDGCDQAPIGGAIQHADFFTGYANNTGQVWTVRPPWNVAGVEFGVGAYTPTAQMKDPTTATLPTGCVYDPTTGAIWVICEPTGGATSVDVEGFDFGLHGGVRLYIHGPGWAAITIKDNNFLNGATSDSNGNSTGGGGFLIHILDQGIAASLDLESNTIDGNGALFPVNLADMLIDQRTTVGSTSVIKYNACLRVNSKCFAQSGAQDPNFSFNYHEGWEKGVGNANHMEAQILGSGTMATYTELFNTYLQPNTIAQGCAVCSVTTESWISNGGSGLTITLVNATNNTYISNADGSGNPLTGVLLDLQNNTYGTVNFTKNYFAPTGANFCTRNLSTTIGTTNWSGNIDMFDASTVSSFGHCPGSFN